MATWSVEVDIKGLYTYNTDETDSHSEAIFAMEAIYGALACTGWTIVDRSYDRIYMRNLKSNQMLDIKVNREN